MAICEPNIDTILSFTLCQSLAGVQFYPHGIQIGFCMAPLFDLRTLVLVYVGIRIGQAVVLIYLWHAQRNYPPAKDWAIGAGLSAIGLFFLALRDHVPIGVSEILSNALLLPGVMLFDLGVVKATGRPAPLKAGLAVCAAALALLIWYSFVTPSFAARIFTHNLAFVIFDFYAACACLSVVDNQKRHTFRLIGSLLLLLVIACCWRIADGAFGITLGLLPGQAVLLWAAIATIVFPMITLLLALQTSQKLQDEINELAHHDMLTGTFNRRAFDAFVNKEWARSVRHGHTFSVLTVDIDHFKQFNDQHGHQVGDTALILVSNAAQTALRSGDIWCRYGGEEFVALLPDTTLEQATIVAERLRAAVEKTSIAIPNGLLNVSVSIGAAERAAHHTHWNQALAVSDAALYQAKAAGRNCVMAGAA